LNVFNALKDKNPNDRKISAKIRKILKLIEDNSEDKENS